MVPRTAAVVDESIDDETFYGIAGLSLSATIFHFIELQAKYKATFNADDLLHTVDALANVFFTRHWGLSYRFKYMQTTGGSTSYHIGGIAFVLLKRRRAGPQATDRRPAAQALRRQPSFPGTGSRGGPGPSPFFPDSPTNCTAPSSKIAPPTRPKPFGMRAAPWM